MHIYTEHAQEYMDIDMLYSTRTTHARSEVSFSSCARLCLCVRGDTVSTVKKSVTVLGA